jgi:uncharacterized membrane protein YczE
VRAVRTAIELGALALGFALGGSVGLGTILLALTVGPIVQATLTRWERPAPTWSGVEDHLEAGAH